MRILLSLSLLLAACGGPNSGTSHPNQPAVAVSMTADEAREAFGRASNAFAFDLWRSIREEPGNRVVSPASIALALDMAFAGARGETAAEMARVLHITDGELLHRGAAALLARWNDPSRDAFTLKVANRLFGERSLAFDPAFVALTSARYGAPLEPLDLLADPEGSRAYINAWVEEQTRERIRELIPEGALVDAALVLTNAIYFLADWQTPFSPNRTRDAEFFADGVRSVEVPMMHRIGMMRYAEADRVQLLELPYRGGEIAMTVVLPREREGLNAVEAELDSDRFSRWVSSLEPRRVDLALPKLRLEPEATGLARVLRSLGMPTAFSRDADFSGMSTEAAGRLHLSEVFHKAFVEVYEQGTEAAAASAVVVTPTSAPIAPETPIVFRADRPFLFFIRDVESGAILFMARVVNPAA